MIDIYINVFLLLLIFIILFKGLKISFYAPKKIKYLSVFVIFAFFIRYISICILFFSKSIKNLYLLKPFFFLNLIYIPIIFIIVFYIFIRNSKINFSYAFIISVVFCILYFFIMFNNPVNLVSNHICGYSMYLCEKYYIQYFIILNIIFFILALMLLSKNMINKIGMYLIIFSCLITVIEFVLEFMGIKFLFVNILTDIVWSITFIYGLKKIKINDIRKYNRSSR